MMQPLSASTRWAILAAISTLLACHPQAPASQDVAPAISNTPEQTDEGGCLLDPEAPRDPDIDGEPRSDGARCCVSDYGFDPQLALRSCGFTAYLGESEELACVHRFRDSEGRLRELRLTSFADLDFSRALALQVSGLGAASPDLDALDLAGVAWSSHADRSWALVDGWPSPRRLGWDRDACSDEAMAPVLQAMAAAPVEADFDLHDALPRWSSPTPAASEARTVETSESATTVAYTLPRDARALLDALAAAAETEDRRAFLALSRPDARMGLPDRRQPGARALVSGDEGSEAFAALRSSLQRLGARPPICPRFDRRLRAAITRGELPMWCLWASEDGLDLLIVALRGQVVDGEADARIEYIGLFPEAPRKPLRLPGEPPAPPIYPLPPLHCGDPHTVDYPGLCPSSEDDEDGDEEDGDEEDGDGDELPPEDDYGDEDSQVAGNSSTPS